VDPRQVLEEEGVVLVAPAQLLEDLERLGVLAGVEERDGRRGAGVGVLGKLLQRPDGLLQRFIPVLLPGSLTALLHRPVEQRTIAWHATASSIPRGCAATQQLS
jgi:hypothetical protein